MELRTMYPPQKDSPTTFLLGAITSTDTFAIVGNAGLLPQVCPYPLTIGPDRPITETVMITAIDLVSNKITFTRGTSALPWSAGTTLGRVFTAQDLKTVQDNIVDIYDTATTVKTDVTNLGASVASLQTTVGDSDSGLVKGLADEIVRAEAAEGSEVLRATNAEGNLETKKINRTELPQIIIDASYSADATKLSTTLTRYNASNQLTNNYERIIPLITESSVGLMTPEAYNEITALRNDVMALQQQGGKFIGISFATKAALDGYVIPSSVKFGDFTYVLDDETKDDATTRYVYNGSIFEFAFIINHDPIGIANTNTPGLVKSSEMMLWTSRTSAVDKGWYSVCYGNGLFVAVSNTGTGGRVMTSPDGITWTERTSAINEYWQSVCYGNGLFVAVANSRTNNCVMTSPDGITWTNRTPAYNNSEWNSVCYGDGLFVAVASSGTNTYSVMTSPDGITWTIRTGASPNQSWTSVCYGNGLFVAVAEGGTGNKVMSSPDGLKWTSRTSATNNAWTSVCYGNGLFVAVSRTGTGDRVMTSPDGITWTSRTSAVDNWWYSVCYGNGLFVAVATSGSGNRIMISSDGITWISRTSAADNSWRSVCYGNGLFVAVGINSVMTSPAESAGKSFVEMDGTMSVIGWDDLNISVTEKAKKSDLDALKVDYTQQIPYAVATGTDNTYAIALPIGNLVIGMAVAVKINIASTGASTLNWNGKGAKPIKKADGTNATNLKAGGVYTFRYDGVNFILQGEGGEYGTAQSQHILAPYTAGTDNGLITGTIDTFLTFPVATDFHAYGTGTANDGDNIYLKMPVGYSSGDHWLAFKDPNLIPANVKSGVTIGKGFKLTGTFTDDATVTASRILVGFSGYAKGVKVNGTMPNMATIHHVLTVQDDRFTIPQGYHTGVGTVTARIRKPPVERISLGINNPEYAILLVEDYRDNGSLQLWNDCVRIIVNITHNGVIITTVEFDQYRSQYSAAKQGFLASPTNITNISGFNKSNTYIGQYGDQIFIEASGQMWPSGSIAEIIIMASWYDQ